MKTYETYKESKISWIEKIPENWEVVKLSHYTSVIGGSTPKSNIEEYWGGLINWITTDDLGKVKGKTIKKSRRTITRKGLENCSASLVKENSVIISCRAPIGHIAINAIESATNQGCKAIEIVDGFESDYIYYFFLAAKSDLESLGSGSTFMELSANNLKSYRILKPSPKEQTQIANYLDYKTGLIDNIIAQKEELIQKLKEQRQAIINEAVTKGLNPNVPLKDSGIEWLGEIPEHWEVIKLRYLADITTGDKDTENREDDGQYPFFVRSQTIERISTYSFDGEAILTAGDGVGVCKVWHYINGKFDYHQRVYMMHNFRKVTGIYLFNFMKENFINEVLKLSAKSTVDSLRRPMFLDFPVAVPPIDEQNSIIDLLNNKQKSIDNSIEGIKSSIEKLKEYRQSLISEAVTGKIDVRDWQVPIS